MTILQKGEINSNIRKMYLFKIFSGVVFFAPIAMLFKGDNNVDLSEIFYLQIVFAMSMVLFEVPTGYFADIYGRRASMIAGAISQSIGIIAYSFSYGFGNFMIVDILMGLGVALYSGANSALVYESLKETNQELEYKKIWGNMQFYNVMTVGVSSVIGGVIANYFGMRYTIYASVPFYFLMLLVAFSFKEPQRTKVIITKGYGKAFFKEVKRVLLESQALRWIILYSGVVLALNQSIYPAYQYYFKAVDLDLLYFGLVFALFQVVSAFSSKYAHKAEDRIGERRVLILLPFMVGLSFFMMGYYVVLWGILFVFFQQFVRGFRSVVVNDYINKLVNSEQRATILSVESLFGKLMYSLILLIWGLSLEFVSLAQTLQYMGLLALVVGGVIGYFIVIKGKL